MKRVTAAVFSKFPYAWDVNCVLRAAGVDSKIVSKHAVQIHPEHVELAREALRRESEKRKAQ